MSATFERALAYTLRNEGEAFVHDPVDRGGPTRYGITLATLSDWRGRQASAAEVAELNVGTVAEIYRQMYWHPLRLEQVQPLVAMALFDTAVLCGVARSVKLAQRALGVPADGNLGPVTHAALMGVHPGPFVLKFVPELMQYFLNIVAYNPTQARFLDGWCRRTMRMLTLLMPEMEPVLPPATPPPQVALGRPL